jgi:hypothetical protein
MSESLITTAQRMSQWQKMRERLNKMTGGLKRYPAEYLSQVEQMRGADSEVRKIVENKLPDVIKAAERAFKQRMLLDVAHNASKFNHLLKEITSLFEPLNKLTSDYIDEFYMDSKEADPTKDFFSPEYHAASVIDEMDMITKQAELFDMFRSDRTRTRRMIEKLYKVKVEQRNLAIQNLIDVMSQIHLKLIEELKELGWFRARGDVAGYIELEKKKIPKLIGGFEGKFKSVYTKYLAELQTKAKESIEKRQKEEEEKNAAFEAKQKAKEVELAKKPVEEVPIEEAPKPIETPKAPVEDLSKPEVMPSRPPAKEQTLLELDVPEDKPIIPTPPVSAKDKLKNWNKKEEELVKEPAPITAAQMYLDIKKVAETKSVGQLIAICSYYSQELEDRGDIQGSMKLLAIAESLVNE